MTGEALVGETFFPALPAVGSTPVAVVPSSSLAAMSGAGRVYAISLAAVAKTIWIANSYFLPDDATVALLVAAAMEKRFRSDLARCRPYTYAMWKGRSLTKRVTERLIRPLRTEL